MNTTMKARMDHSKVLKKLCRVCGRLLVTKAMKSKYLCGDFTDQLLTVFGVSATDPDIHPVEFCHACRVVLQKSASDREGYRHRTNIFTGWCTHAEDSCGVCEHYQQLLRGGRPKKMKHTPGRPPSISPRYCVQRIREVAPPLLPHADICKTHLHLPLAELSCPICADILREPVELTTCRSVVCADCLCKWLQHHDKLTCPCCYSGHLEDYNTIQQASPLVVTLLKSICVICGQCHNHMQMSQYQDHSQSCPATRIVRPHTSIDDVLHQPASAPLTPIEQKLQTSLARRSVTDENVLQLKTGGKVLIFFTKHGA